MRCIGQINVGSPMRSPSGSITCRMKSSNEFRSMPRNVTPEEFMETREPHNFSLGVCRLTMTMEFGSKDALVSLPDAELRLLLCYNEIVFNFSDTSNFGSVSF